MLVETYVSFGAAPSRYKWYLHLVHIQVGQCGNQIGNTFWNTITAEHKLAKDGNFTGNKDAEDQHQLDKIYIYFKEAGELGFIPRVLS